MAVTDFVRELDKMLVMSHLIVDGLDDVEDVISICTFQNDCMEIIVCHLAQFRLEVFVGGCTEIEPFAPSAGLSSVREDIELVDVPKNSVECNRVVIL